MAKFYGKVGYGISTETSKGVWEDVITDKNYSGDIVKNSQRLVSSGTLNDNVTISNDISIIADLFASENFYCIRYVEYLGVKWKVTNVEVQYPRLILSMGGVYNGQ